MIPEKATISEISAGLHKRDFSSVELVKHYLAACERDTLNAFISLNESALEQALSADRLLARGEGDFLTGIPLAIKDVLMTKGLRTTAGSNMLGEYIPPYTATAVQRLLDCGMVILGKTNCDEFAMGSSNENSAFGPVKNPYDPSRVAGGSSGGSAAAVAARLAPVALGSDTGGSVRLPASFCGIIGFKPTYGRISRYGLIAMASSLDQIGIFGHSAHDVAVLLEAMAGYDALDATSSAMKVDAYAEELAKPLGKVVIGIPKEYVDDAGGVGVGLLEATREQYAKVPGVSIVDISLPYMPFSLAVYYLVMCSEVSANLARFDGLRYGYHTDETLTLDVLYRANRTKGFGAEVKRRIMMGTYALSAGYYDAYYAKAEKVRRLIANDLRIAFKKVDVILGPTSPTPAFKLGEKQEDPLTMYLSDIYTVAANLTGAPAVSYPAGTVAGLPVGLQLMGSHWSEGTLLNLVNQLPAITYVA